MKICFILFIIFFFVACNNNNETSLQKKEETDTAIVSNHDHKIGNNKDTSVIENDNADTNSNLIIPAEKIGKAVLNTDASDLEQLFGKPDLSDAAMGKAWMTWYGKKNKHNNKTELNIYTAYKDSTMRGKSVQQVRTTSSYFTTQNNIHVYSSLDTIKKAFPNIREVDEMKQEGRNIAVYDDVKNGIAFEVADLKDRPICIAIFVHNKDKKITDIYIHPPY